MAEIPWTREQLKEILMGFSVLFAEVAELPERVEALKQENEALKQRLGISSERTEKGFFRPQEPQF